MENRRKDPTQANLQRKLSEYERLVGKLVYQHETLAEARASIRTWVERYNHAHLHSALAYATPMEY